LYKQLNLDESGEYVEHIEDNFRGLIYIAKGGAIIGGHDIHEGEALFIERGGNIEINSKPSCVAMICLGKAHGEPVHQHGPFVD
jgi:redox-sensitive bicupin YhaK (pirin superfamily)